MITLTYHSKSQEQDYGKLIRSEVYALWSGATDLFTFVDNMSTLTYRFLTFAWNDGLKECGIDPDEQTIDERYALVKILSDQYQYIVGFGNDIVAGSKASGGKLTPLTKRAQMWSNRYSATKSQAKQMACGDQKLKWVRGPTSDPCVDCVRMNGRVYRASVWKKYNLQPRSHDLSCRGFKCLCEFLVVDEPVTPGRPPALVG